MRYSQISVLITALFLCLVSCKETIGEQHDSPPQENDPPTLERQNLESPFKKDSIGEPLKRRQNQDNKKKRKASDTLKPKMALLKSA